MNTQISLLIAFIALTAIPNGYADDKNNDQWGEWATNPNYASQSLEPSTMIDPQSKNYGSGIAGVDENLLHELDQSSLFDYQTQVIESSVLPEFSTTTASATGITADIEEPIIDVESNYE